MFAQIGKTGGVVRDINGHRLETRQIIRHQFTQSHGRQQAFRNATGKARALEGEDRHTGPERVGGRRVAVAGAGVERKIGLWQAAEMIGHGREIGEDQAFRRKTAFGRSCPQIGLRQRAQRVKPENGAFHRREYPHPAFEDRKADLGGVIESGEDDGIPRQPMVGSVPCPAHPLAR